MKTHIETYRDAIINIDSIDNTKHLVQIFELVFNKLNLCTIQEMAEQEGKSYNGILKSNNYLKIVNGKSKLVCKGIRNSDEDFPW